MKRLFMSAFIFTAALLYGQDEALTLSRITGDIESYRNRRIVMDLRLKQVDYLFEKIIFYDSENIDIEFSISDKKKRKLLGNDLLNAHDGVLYSVTFIILDTGRLGGIIGELHEFTPVFSGKIPEKVNQP